MQALDAVETEQQRSAALEREVHTLRQVKQVGASAASRATSLEHQSQDLQLRLQHAEAEKDVQQVELLEARKELQRLAVLLDEERSLNTSLCDQAKLFKADLSVCPNSAMPVRMNRMATLLSVFR